MPVVTYKCPNCGGEVTFDPEAQKFRCDYCSSFFTEKDLKKPDSAQEKTMPQDETVEQDSPQGGGDDSFTQHTVVYSCPSCGAEVVCDETTAATFCYYCHNPVVLSNRLDGHFKPDKVIPFTISRDQAKTQFLEWTRKKWFVPRAFFSEAQIEKLTGVYFPYWFADYEAHGRYDTDATTRRVWRTGETEHTEINYFRVARAGNARFRDISRPALKKANGELVRSVQPFKTEEMIDFSMSYLSGFQAEKRDIEREELEQDVNEEARRYMSNLLQNTVTSYATVSNGTSNIVLDGAGWRYALLPVWVLSYNGSNKMYHYAMNGQTGRICGELPIDWKRAALLALGIGVSLFAIFMLGGAFLL